LLLLGLNEIIRLFDNCTIFGAKMFHQSIDEVKIGVIGLGYVGLPLAVEFGKQFDTLGFDINTIRIETLLAGYDETLEVSDGELAASHHLSFSCDTQSLADCNVFIVTVPTPIDSSKRPDLEPLQLASKMLAGVLKSGDTVIYESTVYPGATEEVCIPILESFSGLALNKGFFVGYSPERINPGDKAHRVTNILKVTSGSNSESAESIDWLYRQVIVAGTHKASSIKVAEAAKVIENTQRDLNIALINELAIIFNQLGIDTEEVLNAAGTKWNFLPFRPGLVGGHCIGVDPYYLTHKAQEIGYHPEVILAGRRINDGMGAYVAGQVVKQMLKKRIHIDGAKVLIMGVTFKEDCPDIRNTKVVDVISEFEDYGVKVDVFDPWVSIGDTLKESCIELVQKPSVGEYDAVILAVAHSQFQEMNVADVRAFGKPNHVLYDIKYVFGADQVDARL
jgi:UDP-N-acetyl-D-glucosamine/UDP-N-acetyl-D-galactosamine dehydrogenase